MTASFLLWEEPNRRRTGVDALMARKGNAERREWSSPPGGRMARCLLSEGSAAHDSGMLRRAPST
jgi:hypothetical protein